MVGTNLKAETIALMDQRTSMEAQMNAIIARLCAPGGPGITGNLLDSEGFPRADIDIPAIRSDRHRLSELRNDHKNITDKIDQNLQVLHSGKLNQSPSSYPRDTAAVSGGPLAEPSGSATMAVDYSPPGEPFATIDEISEESPASVDGLCLGDLVLRFGDVGKGDDLLPRLASEAQLNQGKPVQVAVLRQGSPLTLTVTPRAWHGRGLLGCHFRIL
ncbi:26S proteasome regulatory subunit [Wolffia australiana]